MEGPEQTSQAKMTRRQPLTILEPSQRAEQTLKGEKARWAEFWVYGVGGAIDTIKHRDPISIVANTAHRIRIRTTRRVNRGWKIPILGSRVVAKSGETLPEFTVSTSGLISALPGVRNALTNCGPPPSQDPFQLPAFWN
jgi:hypothetical protein